VVGGLWHLVHKLFVDILCVRGVIPYKFFSCSVVGVAYVDIPCVVTVAEDFVIHHDGGSALLRRRSIYCLILIRFQNTLRGGCRMSASEFNDCMVTSIGFTCRLVYDFTYPHYSILIIVHFDDENSRLWLDFEVGDFSRRAIYTFQRALVDLFVGFLVC